MNNISIAFDDLMQFDTRLSNDSAYVLVSHHISADEYQSMKIHMSNLAYQLKQSIYGIRSAAAMLSSDFALSGHDHDIYTSAWYHDKFTSGNLAKIANIADTTHMSSTQMSISAIEPLMPDVFAITSAWMPKLGTLQFVSVNDMNAYSAQLAWNNKNFVGWVPADGRSYTIDQFIMSAYIPNVFNITGSTFKVPDLNDFFKTAGNSNNNNSYDSQSGRSALIPHIHQIQQSGSQSFTFNTVRIENETYTNEMIKSMFDGKIATNGYTVTYVVKRDVNGFSGYMTQSGNPYLSYGQSARNDERNYPIYLEYLMNLGSFQLGNAANVEQDGTDDIPYPSYNLMPALVFVGPSRYSDFSQYMIDEL